MNTIEKAIKYFNEPEAIRRCLNNSLRTADLEVPNIAIGAQTVKYQHIEFGDYTLGNYDRNNGYDANDIQLTWKEFTLTQDKGNKLMIDKMDDEEAMANGIVRLGNRFYDKVVHPTLDTYRLTKLAATPRSAVINMTLTADNILSSILAGKARLEDMKIDTNALLLYITPDAKALLKEAALKKGYWEHGHWNGVLDAEVDMFDKCKVIPVPAKYFGNADVQAILVHKDAAPAMIKYKEVEYFDKIPGYGKRRSEVDIGVYHDAFVYDELNRAVCLFIKSTTATKNVTYAGGDGAEGTAPTQAAVAPGAAITLKANAFTLTGKTFAGWTDGSNVYQAGDTYYVGNANATLTARWK
ncbi:MAG: hypothetical protein IJ308_04390 [Clostridia bacterium]|nr:hypothetical protein [Clostridia bacterium]